MKNKGSVLTAILILALSLFTGCGSYFDLHDSVDQIYSLITESSEEEENEAALSGQDGQYDEDNVGEIYYQGIDEEHIAETESGMMYADNEILIVAADGVSYSDMEKLSESYDAEIVGWIEQTGDYQWLLSGTYTIDELENLVAELSRETIVDSAYINGIVEMSGTAIEEQYGVYYGQEWQSDLQNYTDGEGKSWGLEVISAVSAWELLANNEYTNPVRIGLIDCGFDEDHEDLGFAETFYNSTVDDPDGISHGTHVAGIMAALTSDTTGICGVYPYGDGNLYGVADGGNADNGGVSSYTENGTFWTSVMGQKIAYAELILRNVKVINQSQGFNIYTAFEKKIWKVSYYDYDGVLEYWNTYDFSNAELMAENLAEFLNRLLIKGYDFVIVSAAGNDSDSSIGHLESKYSSWVNMIGSENYPDVYDRIIVVGAVNSDLGISEYSNGGTRVDIYAPGGEGAVIFKSGKMIYSTTSDNQYGYMEGTSMAAPHVSGVAACVWAANNALTGAQVKEIICSSKSELCTSCNMIDACIAVEKAISAKAGETDEATEEAETEEPVEEVEYGGILGWVVNVENEDEKIEGAEVTVVNIATGESETTTTDSSGHFELVLTEGEYTLTVVAQGYEGYIWPDGNDFQNPIVVKNQGVNYLDDWIKMTPAKLSRKNYYNSEYTLVYYEVYAYYDNGLLCSSTLYKVNYYSGYDGYYRSAEYTFLYLYDENWDLTDIVLDVLTISDWYDESTGEIVLGYEYDASGKSTRICIYPETESIEQEKFGVDSSKTEEIYEDYPVVTTDVSTGWAAAYLKDIFAGDEPTDATECRLIYVNDDTIPEIWMDYGYGYAGAEVYTQKGDGTDCVHFDQGYAEWIEKENLLWTSGGHMDEYYDVVYQIQDGEFVSIGSGVYGTSDNSNVQYDEQGYPLYDCYWNGVKVTEDEYEKALRSVFDEAKAESSYQNIYTYKQCKLLLQSLTSESDKILLIPEEAFEWNGHYYYVYSDVCDTWEAAKEYCESLGGYLAVIGSEEENDALYTYITEQGIKTAYFGYSDVESEGVWTWVANETSSLADSDGESADTGGVDNSSGYEKWAGGEPNNENEDYAEFYYKYTSGEWNDGNFGKGTVRDEKNFICEWSLKYN